MKLAITAAALVVAIVTAAQAQTGGYPSKPLTLIVPYAAGSGMDAMSRVVGDGLSARLGSPVVIENKPGANGTLGTAALARAKPDGYTLGMGNSGTHASSLSLIKSVSYDPLKDFVPIGKTGSFIFMLAVNSSVPATSLQELVAYAKMNQISYGVANVVGLAVLELLRSSHGLNATAVPYRAMPQAVADLIAGRTSAMVVDRGPILPHLRSKAARALMLTSGQRSRLQPDIPTAREAGTNIDLISWVSMFAPAATPAPIVQRLRDELRKVVNDQKIRERLALVSFEADSASAEEVTAQIKADIARWRQMAKDAAIKPR